MADIEERPYQLGNIAVPDGDEVVILDRSDFTDPKQSTINQILALESTPRIAADSAIKTGAGLLANGLMPSSPASNYLKNTDFIAAGLSMSEYNALILLDAAINNLDLSGELNILVQLTSAEILALNSTAVTKIVASVIGTFYGINECYVKSTFVSTPYVCTAAGIIARYVGGTDAIVTIPQALVQSAATTRKKILVAEHEIPLATAIEFFAPGSDPTGGDGTIEVIFRYQILPDFAGVPVAQSPCCIKPFSDVFTNADLTASGNLEIHHAQGTTQVVSVTIMDNTGYVTSFPFKTGNEAGADTTNYVTVPIGLGIAGTWQYMLAIM